MDNEFYNQFYTPEQQLLIFGDRNYFNNQNNLPFSIADIAAKNANVDVFPSPQDLYTGAIANNPTYLAKQQIGFPTGITASSAAVPFGTAEDIAQGFIAGSPSDTSFPGANFEFLQSANEDENENEGEESSESKTPLQDLFKAALRVFIPGFNPDNVSTQRFTPGSTVKGGIYSLGTFNQPVGMVNDFYDPISGTNRFDRAAARYKTTGSVVDLFGSSRTGAEFFRKLRERKAAKEAAKQASAKLTQDIRDRADRGESMSDIGKALFTGPGMAFEQKPSFSVKPDGSKRFYGGR